MNNPNPFVPQGSLLEQQSKRRSRFKLAVFCVLAVGIAGLAAMLIQGCKREQSGDQNTDNSQPPVDTNSVVATDTNQPPMEATNPPGPPGTTENAPGTTPQGTVPPVPTPPPTPAPPPPAPAPSEYVVLKGDTYSKIATANGLTVKALEEANPNIPPTRLRIGEKLVLPAGASPTGAGEAAETESGIANAAGEEVYVVKAGDTLTRIHNKFGVSVKAIEAENNLTTTKIKVGQKLKIPAKPEATQAPENAPPTTTTAPEPEPAPANNPPAAPSNPPAGQQ